MKSTFVVIVVGVLLFGISAGASWFLIDLGAKLGDETAEQVDDANAAVVFPPTIDEENLVPEMPVALRPDVPITVEAVTELAQSIMKKQQELVETEKRIKQEEKRIKLLFEDLRQEREELQAFGQRIDGKVTEAREAVELLKLENANLSDQANALSKLERKTGKKTGDLDVDDFDRRVKITKAWIDELDPASAARQIKQIANNGKIELAAAVTNSLDKYKIAKILLALEDEKLVDQMLDAYAEIEAEAEIRISEKPGRRMR